MEQLSLLSEYMALILILIIMSFFYDARQDGFNRVRSQRRMMYWNCLGLSGLSIILNIATVMADRSNAVSLPLDIAINSLYYYVSILMSLVIADYLLARLFEHVYDKHDYRFARVVLVVMAVVYAGIVLWNLSSGVLFYFDENAKYIRGTYSAIVYAAPAVEVIMVVWYYRKWRDSVSDMVRQVLIKVPFVVVLLVVFQLSFPDQLLNGMIAAMACLIIFLSFQSSQIELDSHTGVANRQSFASELDLRIASRQNCQIILITLRKFSRVNYLYGNSGGDAILVQIATALTQAASNGRVFRYSNVGFLVLTPSLSSKDEEINLNLIMNCMRQQWLLGDNVVPLRYSVVELKMRDQGWTSEDVVDYLDYAAHYAKNRKLELVHFDEAMERRYARSETLLKVVQDSIRDDRFQVWYQPIYHRAAGDFSSAEALIRLPDKDGSYISPEEFIPIAEENGLVDEISWIAIEHACKLLSSGDVQGLKTVTVNLSMHQLMQRDLHTRLFALLDQYGLKPESIKLEVTERVMAENGSAVKEVMESLESNGVSFLLDDFGTGYSNFSNLMNFPFAAIKLDRSLIVGLADSQKSQTAVDILIPFFHALGHRVVAEGVENAEQAERALGYGADFIQGFYFAKPMPPDDLPVWYRENSPQS